MRSQYLQTLGRLRVQRVTAQQPQTLVQGKHLWEFAFFFLLEKVSMELVACAVVGGALVYTGLVSSEFGAHSWHTRALNTGLEISRIEYHSCQSSFGHPQMAAAQGRIQGVVLCAHYHAPTVGFLRNLLHDVLDSDRAKAFLPPRRPET